MIKQYLLGTLTIMMQDSLDRISEFSRDIKTLYEKILPQLSPKDQEIVLRLCGNKTVATAISIIMEIDGQELTYREIAENLGLHHSTVRQYCHALSESFSISYDRKKAIAHTGRRQKLLKVS
jgi:predicted AAA+ superfamily ATPase